MNLTELNKIAHAMVAPGKGILAADESTGTIKKRFDAIGVESTTDSRRDYRELLFRSNEAMSKYVSGVILYDETIRQKAKDGTSLVKLIEQAGSIPGIKVDKGSKPLVRANSSPKGSTACANASSNIASWAPGSPSGAP
jgi:fructose-bisphosphate aldolase class I